MYIQYGIEVMPKGMEDPDTASQRALLFTDIDNYMKKFKANAVVEGITDAQWQEHLENLKRYNVDEYIRLWQVHYDSKQQ